MERCETEPFKHTLVSAGVDYLTATAYRHSQHDNFDALGRALVEMRAKLGHEVKTWKSGGYHGLITDGVIRGVRHDTHIIKLSSDVAHDEWKQVAELATNISRLDVEITLELETAAPDFFRRNHVLALSNGTGRGRKRNVTLIQSTTDGDSLYLGKRSSEIYARVYDKGREQKTAPSGKLVRQELEYKGERAKEVAAVLLRSESAQLESLLIVSDYMRRAGLQTTWHDGKRAMAARESPASKPVRLNWLRDAVKPSITRLREAGLLVEVLEALGLSDHVRVIDDPHDPPHTKE